MRRRLLVLVSLSSIALFACSEDDPVETGFDAGGDVSADVSMGDVGGDGSGGALDCVAVCADLVGCDEGVSTCSAEAAAGLASSCETACADDPSFFGGLASLTCESAGPITVDTLGEGEACLGDGCPRAETDHVPGADDDFGACVSDGDEYVQVEENISSIGRIAGYEQIADLLWRDGAIPTPEDFLDAREIYAADEGLDSRVQRREDEHYEPVSDGEGGTLRCRDEGVPEMDPDRCVGPAKILPILNDAFVAGIDGEEPQIQAARIHGALLWFLYVSSHKEAVTCIATPKDCDSSYAYYTGGVPRSEGLGLAGAVRDVSTFAHDRIWDGILGVRCWRDLEPDTESPDLTLHDQALAQLDRGLLYGVSRIVAERLVAMQSRSGVEREADVAFLQILGPVLLREAGERGGDGAATLQAIFDGESDITDAQAVDAVGALQAVFPCP